MNGKEEVWNRAEAFRREHLVGSLHHLPVDVFSLTELRLGLDVIPFDDLFAKYDSDAAITHDFTGIYVDTEAYVLWEKGPVWKQNRLRFSVAHELGHYMLHREVATQARFESFDDFTRWTRSHGEVAPAVPRCTTKVRRREAEELSQPRFHPFLKGVRAGADDETQARADASKIGPSPDLIPKRDMIIERSDVFHTYKGESPVRLNRVFDSRFGRNCSGSGAGVSPVMGASRPRSHQRGQEARSGRRDARPTT